MVKKLVGSNWCVDNWLVTIGLVGDKWLVAIGWWVDNWLVTIIGSWKFVGGNWLVAVGWWQLVGF